MLILLLYFNSSSIGFTYCLLTGTQVAVQLNNVDVYGDSLVLLVQRSNFQTPKRLEAELELTCSNTGVIGHGHLKFTASSKLEVNYPATSIKE